MKISRVTGQQMRKIRKGLGLTQKELAVLMGVATNSIARQERGEMGIRESLARLIRLTAQTGAKVRRMKKER
jgi:transcriptional regulator with XRE-family HTH domain